MEGNGFEGVLWIGDGDWMMAGGWDFVKGTDKVLEGSGKLINFSNFKRRLVGRSIFELW